MFPLLPGDTGNARHHAVVLLARRLSAANPGCKASGESLGKSAGESLLFPADFPWLSWARSLQTFPNPSGTRGTNIAMPTMYFREEWVQGGHRPGAEFEAAQASTFPFLVLISISSLRTRLLPNTIRVLKTYQIWDGFCALAKPNEGRRSSATLTGMR